MAPFIQARIPDEVSFANVPITRLFAVMFSIISLLITVSIGFATYREQFHQVREIMQKQEVINERTRNEIGNLQITLARLEGALNRNTEALVTNASKR